MTRKQGPVYWDARNVDGDLLVTITDITEEMNFPSEEDTLTWLQEQRPKFNYPEELLEEMSRKSER